MILQLKADFSKFSLFDVSVNSILQLFIVIINITINH